MSAAPAISVVIPAYNAAETVGATVRAVMSQRLDAERFECIVVDDGSTDGTAAQARDAGARVLELGRNQGVSAARNAGLREARGGWVAFLDADAVPTRRWLASYLAAAQRAGDDVTALAGRTIGLESATPAARFVDLVGGLDSDGYIRHEALSWAPIGNCACRRDQALAIGGLDERLRWYESPDFFLRLLGRFGGRIEHVDHAVVLHRHRRTWGEYWRQQRAYGRGRGQFLLRYRERWPWSAVREAAAWGRLALLGAKAAIPGGGDRGLVRRGLFVKHLAQRVGFVPTYFSPAQRRLVQTWDAGAGA